ncbi:MAG TPA: zf-HC2 domain-containing protein [Candidatus Cybelea sp.]|nr:zf-HC2 domain-containing protein [Candidatus Cybelea sp.]
MKWIWNRCRRRQEISLFAAGALGQEEKIELERHLAVCGECRNHYAEIKTLTAPLAGWEKNLSGIEATPASRMRWGSAVHDAGAPSAMGQSALKNFWRISWEELIWPSRGAWAGLAALWVAMLAINVSLSDHGSDAGARASSTQEIMQAWAEQNRVLAELVQPSFTLPAPPPNLPHPRSQKERSWEIL